jgi:hypothetical protein
MFVPQERVEALVRALENEGEGAWVIGRTHALPGTGVPCITVI